MKRTEQSQIFVFYDLTKIVVDGRNRYRYNLREELEVNQRGNRADPKPVPQEEEVVMRAAGYSGAIALVLAMPALVLAGPIGNDPAGLPDYTGSVSFNADDLLLVDLDYAVYEPGVYPDDGINGDDPSDGTEYVYAYQAFNVSADQALTALSIGLPNEGHDAGNALADPLSGVIGGLEPSMVIPLSTSMIYRFTSPELVADEYSSVVLFTSPYPPALGPGSVQYGSLVDTQTVPTPIPEPTTAASLLLVMGVLAGVRRR